ncbi:hypothetical protein SELMODRAFT_409615 [Selaginella moellendorffii]|uniref:Uncharacterized protein n=1 Tax=Selaginella moellendorffii TaxID=88036 RepID=D8RC06_SELML|nr:hypothetical protein SELMODRAFT_409615 [Selaginella moellendorffii]
MVDSREEGAPEGEKKEDGTSPTLNNFYDLPKGVTHKEMIAARHHYLKCQARCGLLPPSTPIRSQENLHVPTCIIFSLRSLCINLFPLYSMWPLYVEQNVSLPDRNKTLAAAHHVPCVDPAFDLMLDLYYIKNVHKKGVRECAVQTLPLSMASLIILANCSRMEAPLPVRNKSRNSCCGRVK